MSDHIIKTINQVNVQIDLLERELREKKRMVNALRALADLEPQYQDTEEVAVRSGNLKPDQFYGKPLATVARQILEIKDQATPVSDIYAMMVEGGYKFDSSNRENAIRTLRISLAKNTAVFHKLPNGTYGLLSWYPSVKPLKASSSTSSSSQVDPEEDYDHSQFDDAPEISTEPEPRTAKAR